MNMTVRHLFSVICAAAALVIGSPLAFGKSMEFSEALRLFSLPSGDPATVLPWTIGSEARSPIEWEHDGIKSCSPDIEKQYGVSYCRTGLVPLTLHRKPTHTLLRRKIEPGPWRITLMGPRMGVTHVSITTNNILSQELEPQLAARVLKTSRVPATIIRTCGMVTSGSQILTYSLPKKRPGFIAEDYSCGSGGCSIEMILVNDKQDLLKGPLSSPCD